MNLSNQVILFFGFSFIMISCAGYSDEQEKAAIDFCGCMENSEDFVPDFADCNAKIVSEFGVEIMNDEGWGHAIEAKCPKTAREIARME